jgi:hypothetical protein
MFSERSREVEMYKKFSQIDFFILAKSILRNNTQAFSSSGQIKKIKKDLGEIGTSLGEINDELSRVEKASYFLAHLYSGEGFTNEKIQEYIGYYARDDASFSGQSLSNDELVLRVKERAFTDILSNTTPN